jgi:hypothetical protein
MHYVGQKTVKLCFSNKPAEHVDEIYLVVDDNNLLRSSSSTGKFTIKPLAQPCGCDTVVQTATQMGWQGTLTYVYDATFTDAATGGHYTASHHASVQVRFDQIRPTIIPGIYTLDTSVLIGTASVHDRDAYPDGTTATWDADGTPAPALLQGDTPLPTGTPPPNTGLPTGLPSEVALIITQHAPSPSEVTAAAATAAAAAAATAGVPTPPPVPAPQGGGGVRADCSYDLNWGLDMPVNADGVTVPSPAGGVSLMNVPTNDDPHLHGTADIPVTGCQTPQFQPGQLNQFVAEFNYSCGDSVGSAHVTWDLSPICPNAPPPTVPPTVPATQPPVCNVS